jgi:hypothetical protein
VFLGKEIAGIPMSTTYRTVYWATVSDHAVQTRNIGLGTMLVVRHTLITPVHEQYMNEFQEA